MLKSKRGVCSLLMYTFILTGCIQKEEIKVKEVVGQEQVEEAKNKVQKESSQDVALIDLPKVILEECPIEIINVFSEGDVNGDDILNITVKNIGPSAIRGFEAYVIFWDEEGKPLTINFGRDQVREIEYYGPYLIKGTSETWSWQPFVDGGKFAKAELFISRVELFNGALYENENARDLASKMFKKVQF